MPSTTASVKPAWRTTWVGSAKRWAWAAWSSATPSQPGQLSSLHPVHLASGPPLIDGRIHPLGEVPRQRSAQPPGLRLRRAGQGLFHRGQQLAEGLGELVHPFGHQLVGHCGQVDPVAGQDGVGILDVLVERRAHDTVGLEGGVGVSTLPRTACPRG
jgi:hypothetical protein